eukprot:scaffold31195_cov68-Phaeocystis_antarctica.AAC.3
MPCSASRATSSVTEEARESERQEQNESRVAAFNNPCSVLCCIKVQLQEVCRRQAGSGRRCAGCLIVTCARVRGRRCELRCEVRCELCRCDLRLQASNLPCYTSTALVVALPARIITSTALLTPKRITSGQLYTRVRGAHPQAPGGPGTNLVQSFPARWDV